MDGMYQLPSSMSKWDRRPSSLPTYLPLSCIDIGKGASTLPAIFYHLPVRPNKIRGFFCDKSATPELKLSDALQAMKCYYLSKIFMLAKCMWVPAPLASYRRSLSDRRHDPYPPPVVELKLYIPKMKRIRTSISTARCALTRTWPEPGLTTLSAALLARLRTCK